MAKYVCSKQGINSRQVGGELNSVPEREHAHLCLRLQFRWKSWSQIKFKKCAFAVFTIVKFKS